MTIGILIPEFPGLTHVFFWREICALRAEGVTVEIISTRRPRAEYCPHDFAKAGAEQTHYVAPPRILAAFGVLMLRPLRSLKTIAYVLSLRETAWLKRAFQCGLILCAADMLRFVRARGVEHIHVHSCASSAHLVAMCRILGGPSYSLALHGDLEVYGSDHKNKLALAGFIRAVTLPLQTQILSYIDSENVNVNVISMAVDTERFIPRRETREAHKKVELITVARLNMAKGHVYALEAIRRVIDSGFDIGYVIVGSGPYESEIRNAIDRFQLQEFVSIVGPAEESRVIKLLHSSDFFLLPSVGVGEAAPVSVMEAMSCGIPVIASKIGGTPDMIEHGKSGILVDQKDVDGIYHAIVQLAKDVSLRRRIGASAREKAVECFDCRVNARRLLEAIRRCQQAEISTVDIAPMR